MRKYSIIFTILFDDERDAKFLYSVLYPDMNINKKNLKIKIKYEGQAVKISIDTYSLSMLRGSINTFLRLYKLVKNL